MLECYTPTTRTIGLIVDKIEYQTVVCLYVGLRISQLYRRRLLIILRRQPLFSMGEVF